MRTARAPISEPISKLAAELPELSFRIASIPQKSSWGEKGTRRPRLFVSLAAVPDLRDSIGQQPRTTSRRTHGPSGSTELEQRIVAALEGV